MPFQVARLSASAIYVSLSSLGSVEMRAVTIDIAQMGRISTRGYLHTFCTEGYGRLILPHQHE